MSSQKRSLRGLSPHFHILVSVSDLYIPTIGLPIFLQQNMQTDHGSIYSCSHAAIERASFIFIIFMFKGIVSREK